MSSISQSWATIEIVLSQHFPEIYRTLNPGAKEADISHFEKSTGLSLPPAIRESLLIHNGQSDHQHLRSFLNFNHLFSVEEMTKDFLMYQELFSDCESIEWLETKRIQNVTWIPGWIKFTDNEGDGYVIDLNPAEEGVVGQIFYRRNNDNTDYVISSSYEEFLAQIAQHLSDGAYEVDEEGQNPMIDCLVYETE